MADASATPTVAIILAAGLGTRMKSSLPKVFHQVGGQAMVHHVIKACERAEFDSIVTVVGPEAANHLDQLPNPVTQHDRNGTGGAAKIGWDAYLSAGGAPNARAVILFGDTPLIDSDTIAALKATKSDVTVLAFEPTDPAQYGRVALDGNGAPNAIIEFKDATEDQRAIALCNAGLMGLSGRAISEGLNALTPSPVTGELYLTDLVAFARQRELSTGLVAGDEQAVAGVNSRAQLAEIEGYFQSRKRAEALDNAVTMLAPDTVHFSWDTKLASDVIVEPNVVFAPGVAVESGATIRAFSHLEGCTVATGAIVGPYARLRPGADVGEGAKVGNFVEIKKARLAKGAKVNHLTYIGDASIGAGANVGAGTITCNYDGYNKAQTIVGDGAFIGSNTALVAPVTVGANAIVSAGATITGDVAADALAIARSEQKNLAGAAKRLHAKLAARKKAAKR